MLVAAASILAACAVVAFSGNSMIDAGLPSMSFQVTPTKPVMPATTDGAARFHAAGTRLPAN